MRYLFLLLILVGCTCINPNKEYKITAYSTLENPGAFIWMIKDREVLKVKADGTFWVEGREVTRDSEVYKQVKMFFDQSCNCEEKK